MNNDGSRNYNNVNNRNLGSVPDLPYKASIMLDKMPEVIASKWSNPVFKAKESYSFLNSENESKENGYLDNQSICFGSLSSNIEG